MVAPTCFGITLPSGSVPSAFWEMLSLGRIRYYVVGGRVWSIVETQHDLSISQKARGTLPEDGNVMPKNVGTTIHN
jgi:hypothetical protein